MLDPVAGLDVHRDNVVAAIRTVGTDGEVAFTKARYPTTRRGVAELAAHMSQAGVVRVAMEATGVYWKSLVRHEALSDRGRVKGPPLQDCRSSLLKLGAA